MSAPRDDRDRDELEALKGLEADLDALRARHRSDPPLDLLRAGSAGVLPDDLQAAVNEHLAESAWSRALVAGLTPDEVELPRRDQQRLLERLQRQAREADRSSGRSWLRPVFVGSAVAALGLVMWLGLRTPADRIATPSPPEATVAKTDPPPAPPFLLPFDKPDVRLSMSALTWRGTTGDNNQLLADLKPALDAYRTGDYAAAEREFTALSARYPAVFEIDFYQGVSRLLLGDAPRAIQSLASAETTADATFVSDVRWYRAVAEQRAGNTEEAVKRLTALCTGKADDAARACSALEQLALRSPASNP